MPTPDQIATIRRLNDTARSNPGTGCIANVTSGFYALPDADRFATLAAIVTFSEWDGDNDPYGEHDFGLPGERERRIDRTMKRRLRRPFSGRWIATIMT